MAKRVFFFVALISVVLGSGSLAPAHAQTNAPAPASAATQVIILGTMHGSHKASTNYSLEVLRKIIVALKPAAILAEQPPEIGGQPTVRNGRVVSDLSGVENRIANLAADVLGVNVIPYDREGRDELYQRTHYFAREQAAHERLDKWLELQATNAPGSMPLRVARLKTEAVGSQGRLTSSDGPEVVNSPAHDMVIVTKHGLTFGVMPKLLAAAGERELAEEFLFINDEWQERNQIMARHIREIAHQFAGKRLVVLAGAEHRYILRELLAKAPEVELKEYHQVPEWTGKTPSMPGGLAGQDRGTALVSAAPDQTLVGIGVEMENGYPDIKRLFPESPAAQSGQLHPGDRILAVAQGDHAFVDTRNLSIQELVQTVRGAPGSVVRLQVQSPEAPPSAPPRTVSLVRKQYKAMP
jgi:hypothetical protein